MATYAFKAVDFSGVPSRGEMEGDDKQAVSNMLRNRGLIVLDVEEVKASLELSDLGERFRRVKPAELTIFTRQFATMVNTGMPLLRSLAVLEKQTEAKKLKETLAEVRGDVEAGLAISDALEKHPKVFDELYVAMVRSGETGGFLDKALLRVADQLEKSDSLRRQIRAAMAYPSLIAGFAFAVLIALVAFLIPVFEKVFKQFTTNGQQTELPGITKVTVGLSHLITGQWYLLIGGAVIVVVAFRKWKRSDRGRKQWDTLKLRFPMKIGGVVQKIALARWSRTFSSLISAGVPILQAVEITGKTAGNKVIEEAMEDVRENIRRGGTISEPMEKQTVFPTMVTQMVASGEEGGALETMLTKIADFYEDEVSAAVKQLASLLEPIMIILVGGIVGFIVISMYLPLFKVYDQIR